MQCAAQDCLGAAVPGRTDAGETMVLLHGSAASAAMWRPWKERLAPGYRVVAPELAENVPSLGDEAKRVAAAIPCCERRVHLVGYSYGGAVALRFALDNPVRVESLTLIEPVFFAALRYAGMEREFARFRQLRDEFEALLGSAGPEEAVRHFMSFWTGADSWSALRPRQQAALVASAPKIASDFRAAFAFDPGPQPLRALAARTLIVRGDASPVPMQTLVDSLHELMPGSAHALVRGANHLAPFTHCAEVVSLIGHHLHAVFERGLR